MRNVKYSWQQIAKASFIGIATTATFYLTKTTGLFSSWFSTGESSNTLVESKEFDITINAGQRRLLQQGGITVANPIPDQVIEVNQQYTYPLDNVFSGNYSLLGAVETGKNSLPNWLSLQPKLLSSVGVEYGYGYGVEVYNNTVFFADYHEGLQIIDVSNASNPRLLSNYLSGLGYLRDVVIRENTAFVVDERIGLRILDVTNTSNPRLLSLYLSGSVNVYGVAVSGNTTFLAAWDAGLQILDTSNTSNPRLLSNYSAGSKYANGVAVSGNTAYVAYDNLGLLIFDVSNTSNPRLLSTYYSGLSGYAYDVAIRGNTAFLADGYLGLLILDITNTSNPRLLSNFTGFTANSVTISDNMAFVTSGSGGLQIIDVSNTSNPQLIGTYPSGSGTAWKVAISGNKVYVADGAFGLQILDVSQASLVGVPPLSGISQQMSITVSARNVSLVLNSNRFTLTLDQLPRVVTSTISDQSIYPGQSLNLFLSSEVLFTNPGNSFLKLSITLNNGLPVPKWLRLAIQPTQLSNYRSGVTEQVVVNGTTVFINNGPNIGLQILDVSTLTNPQLLSTYRPNTTTPYIDGVALSGSKAFVTNPTLGLVTLDVSNMSNPKLIANYPSGGGAIVTNGGIAFVASGSGLLIFNVSNATYLQLLSIYPSTAYGLAISNNKAFLAYGNIQILDVSNTSNPQLLSTYGFPGTGDTQVAISGNTAFVANMYVGLKILDINNITNPRLLFTYSAGSGRTNKATIAGSTAFVAVGTAGLQILDINNASNPLLLGTHPGVAGGEAYDIAIKGKIAFVADYFAGLLILDLSQWQLTASPGPDDVGNYQLQLIATDELGGSASTQPFIIRVEGPPRFNGNISTQYAKVGRVFNYFIPQGLVSDPNNDPISFTVVLSNNQSLPSWLSFSGISAAFVGTPQSSNVGNITILLSATDNIAGFVNTTFKLITSHLPVVNQPLSNTFARVNQFFQLSIPNNTFSHPDGLPLNYSAQLSSQVALPSWLRFNTSSLLLSGQPNSTDAGVYDLRIIVTDIYLGQAAAPLTLSVGNGVQVNRLINSQLAAVSQRYTFAVPSDCFVNLDGTAFSLQPSALPSWLTFAATTAQFSGTPLASSRGTTLITLTATDFNGGTAMQAFNMTVTYFPQVVTPLSDQIAPIDRPYQFNVSNATFIDQNGYALTYRAEQANGQALPNWLNFNATALRFFGTPNITQALRYSVAVIATNPLGAEGRDEFSLFAEHYPTIQQPIPNAVAGVDIPSSITISGSSFNDLDNDPLNYTVTSINQSPLPNWLSFDARTLVLSGTPLAAQLGNISLLVTATDPSSGSAQQNFTLTVRYLPKVSQSVGSIPPVREEQLLNYTLPAGTFTIASGAPLNYNASLDSGASLPAWLNFTAATQHFIGTPTVSDIGSLIVRVIAEDGQGGAASTPLTFVITPNYPPVLVKPVSNEVASVYQAFRLVIPPDTFSDANNDPLTYSVSQVDGRSLPRWLHFDAKAITFSGTPDRGDTGDFSEKIIPIRLTARDDRNGATAQFNINVQGTSSLALFIQIAAPLATVFTAVYATYKKRALCFNRYKKERYQSLDIKIQAGEMFEHKFGDLSLLGKKIQVKTPRELQGYSRFFLSPRNRVPGGGDMPSWMKYNVETNSLQSKIPVPDNSPPELIVQVKDEAGVVYQQFTLHVAGLKTQLVDRSLPSSDVELSSVSATV